MANLISIDTYKQAKAISSSKDDERLNIIIPAVSQFVKTYCGNAFVDYYSSDYTETISLDWARKRVQVTEWPLVSITSVSERTSPSNDYDILTEGTEFVANYEIDCIDRIGQNWPTGVGAVKVVYKAGYSTLPYDLVIACVDLVHYYLRDEYKQMRTLSGATVRNEPSSTITGNIGLPDHIKRVLDMYRNI